MVIGIDLAGPSNHQDTSLAILQNRQIQLYRDLTDYDIYNIVSEHHCRTICIDAPLTYSETGGNRPSDTALRHHLNERGFNNIALMAPTFNRMIYLTARGIRLSRMLLNLDNIELLECHPGAWLVLSGYDYEAVCAIKNKDSALGKLSDAIENQGYHWLDKPESDHDIMATACALACQAWLDQKINWSWPAEDLDTFTYIA